MVAEVVGSVCSLKPFLLHDLGAEVEVVDKRFGSIFLLESLSSWTGLISSEMSAE